MTQNVINEHTDENIKNYLSEEKTGDLGQLNNPDFGEDSKKNIFKNKKVILVVVLLIVIAVSSLFYFTRMKGKQSFDETKVMVSIEVLGEIASGEEVVFDIKLRRFRSSFFMVSDLDFELLKSAKFTNKIFQ